MNFKAANKKSLAILLANLFIAVLFVISIFAANSAKADTLIVPNNDQYQDFLLEPYKPGKPSIVAFKDPHCGYCIKALGRLDKLSEYNVYMFWAGILGERSERTVAKIMQCAEPISQSVFDSVMARSSDINCDIGDKQSLAQLNALNDGMVANYQPNSVPSYFFGGRRVHIGQLDKFKRDLQMNITPIQLQWERYTDLRVDDVEHTGLANAIIFLSPDSLKKPYILQALNKERKYNWFVVDTGCKSGVTCSKKQKLAEELKLLMDLSDADVNGTSLVINGTVINKGRYNHYFSRGLATILASS